MAPIALLAYQVQIGDVKLACGPDCCLPELLFPVW